MDEIVAKIINYNTKNNARIAELANRREDLSPDEFFEDPPIGGWILCGISAFPYLRPFVNHLTTANQVASFVLTTMKGGLASLAPPLPRQ